MIRTLRYGWVALAPALDGHTPPLRNPPPPLVKPEPRMPLSPIQWGKPDRALGHAVCQHVADATPPIVIEFNPVTHARLCRVLRSYRIPH